MLHMWPTHCAISLLTSLKPHLPHATGQESGTEQTPTGPHSRQGSCDGATYLKPQPSIDGNSCLPLSLEHWVRHHAGIPWHKPAGASGATGGGITDMAMHAGESLGNRMHCSPSSKPAKTTPGYTQLTTCTAAHDSYLVYVVVPAYQHLISFAIMAHCQFMAHGVRMTRVVGLTAS